MFYVFVVHFRLQRYEKFPFKRTFRSKILRYCLFLNYFSFVVSFSLINNDSLFHHRQHNRSHQTILFVFLFLVWTADDPCLMLFLRQPVVICQTVEPGAGDIYLNLILSLMKCLGDVALIGIGPHRLQLLAIHTNNRNLIYLSQLQDITSLAVLGI